MVGRTLTQQNVTEERIPSYYSVKEAVFPFAKFSGVDPLLSPEMRSTGEVMGVGRSFGAAFAKAQLAAGTDLPSSGMAFLSVRDADKVAIIEVAQGLVALGFKLIATRGTARELLKARIACETINKVMEGRPHIVDSIKNGEISFIINTTEGRQAIADSFTIRRSALQRKVCYTTTIAGAQATVWALQERQLQNIDDVNCLQELHCML
jgi:carbamoyl-phosphate synthase large subunit